MLDGVYSSTVMRFIGGFEWIILVIVVIVIFIGAKKIPELARGFGRAKTEFEMAKVESERELRNFKKNGMAGNTTPSRDKLESVAHTLGIDHNGKDDETLRLAIEKELDKDEVV
jgi:sec-independent protein translocase protein TatA